MSYVCACGSCLRVRTFETYEAAHEADCQCGATSENADGFCACEGCLETAAALLAGQREGVPMLTIGADRLRGWTPENGLVA